MKNKITYTLLFFFFFSLSASAANKFRLFGYVIDDENHGIELANVYLENTTIGTTTNANGYYELITELRDSVTIVFSMVGYEPVRHTIKTDKHVMQISVQLRSSDHHLNEVSVVGQRRQMSTLDLVDPSKYKLMPNSAGGIESLLITFTGVSSSNELSSQYNVRGGNYDENAVYVNGIEVYRPLLIRSGQQEGLSFVNPDMVQSLGFSSGGYDARYGDKMSSVLDIEYKKPSSFESSVSMSLLGGSAYVGTSKRNFTQMHGIRYKSVQSLLNTMDTKAEYRPTFVDYQTYLTWQPRAKWELTFLGNFSRNKYFFQPQSRSTSFGTYNMGRNFTVYFEGNESDLFSTGFGAFTLNYKPKSNLKLSLISSAFNTNESETYDILGEYVLSEVKMDLNEEDKQGSVLGIGKYQEHARNRLNATVSNISHVGEWDTGNHKLRWGLTFQSEVIRDKISEWQWRDSAGYSLPSSSTQLNLYYTLKSDTSMTSFRGLAYLQDTYRWQSDAGILSVTAGVRANYWSFNKEMLVSPRMTWSYIPHWKHEYSFRFATGLYYQAPFYKELRQAVTDSLGNVHIHLNNRIKAQRSLHFVVGADHYFRGWGRPFKLTGEAYLKLADRVISYQVDNVQIRYSGLNDAKAYSAGVDFKLFGELVPGADSWINLSLMNSKQDVQGDSYVLKTYDSEGKVASSTTVYPGYYARPNEQRFIFSMMFQDYWPTNPKYRVHLKTIFSDGLPIAAPANSAYAALFREQEHRTPAYKRVDIGVSRVLVNGTDNFMNKSWLRHVKNIWLNFEIFNLMDFKNVNSYYWISDVDNNQWAVPNYLTGRQFNLRIMVDIK